MLICGYANMLEFEIMKTLNLACFSVFLRIFITKNDFSTFLIYFSNFQCFFVLTCSPRFATERWTCKSTAHRDKMSEKIIV